MKCIVCSGETQFFGDAEVLGKYQAQYIKCSRCGYIQPLSPFWLDEAYSNAIGRSDMGLLARNQQMQRVTETLIHLNFDRQSKFVDYGGGYGVFVRMMRDRGFNFFRQDSYCANLFAEGFDADLSENPSYELVTAFEVFEHLVNPFKEIEKMMRFSRNIFFSTLLLPEPAPALDKWWYFSLREGQHVSFYTLESLRQIAKHFDLNLLSNGTSLHLLTERNISSNTLKLATHRRLSPVLNLFLSRSMSSRSLLASDYFALTGKKVM
jgi:hypothetical protein